MKKKQVWFFQPEVTHYRLPVFDLLDKRYSSYDRLSIQDVLLNIFVIFFENSLSKL